MSYCVNCGVELRESEKSCPLCKLEVVNPINPYSPESIPAYPPNMDYLAVMMNRRLSSIMILILIYMPAAICIVCDFVLNGTLTWSRLVIGASIVLSIFVSPYFLYRKIPVVIPVFIDTFVILAYLYYLEGITPKSGWFWPIAFPVIFVLSFLVGVMSLVFQYTKIATLYISALLMLCCGIMLIVLEITTDYYSHGEIHLGWSAISFIPLILLAGLYVIVERKRSMKSSIKKKLHI